VELNRVPESDDGRFTQAYDPSQFANDLDVSQGACTNTATDPGKKAFCDQLIQSLQRAAPGSFNSVFSAHPVGVDGRLGFAWNVQGRAGTVVRGGLGRYTGQFPEIITTESRSVLPGAVPLNLANGPSGMYLYNFANPNVCVKPNGESTCATMPTVQPGTLNQLNAQSTDPLFFVARVVNRLSSLNLVQPSVNLHNPYSMQYGLTVDQPLKNEAILSVAWVGTQGRHLLRVSTPDVPVVNLMQVTSVTAMNGPAPCIDGDGTNCRAGQSPRPSQPTPFPVFTASTVRPVGNPGITRTLFESTAISNYNSLQVQLRSRPHASVQFGAAFTWSHALDDASDFFDTANGPALPQDSFHRSEYASADFDARLRTALYAVWQTPARAPLAARNWTVSGMFLFQTGQPFTSTSAIDVNQDGSLTDRLSTTSGLVPGTDRRTAFVLTAPSYQLLSQGEPAFAAQQCLDLGTTQNRCDGAVGRNTFRAPSVGSLDMALVRQFHLGGTEARVLQARVECFNLLNRAEFGIPVRILETPSFGSAVNTIAPNRMVQLSVRLTF
jgi:hypothetical protein